MVLVERGRSGVIATRPAIGESTSEQRQALRGLMTAVLGSTNGEEAEHFVFQVLGRHTMVVSMSATEIDVVSKALQAKAEE
jgi:hypothetical protein